MIRAALLTLACGGLCACASVPHGPPTIAVQVVKVPVAEPCAADPGPGPSLPDTPAAIAAAPNVFERAKLYASGRQLRLDWEARLEAANAACRAAPAPNP